MRFAFIAQHRGIWQTRQLCQALEVSRAGFYEWLGRAESRRARDNRELTASIRTSFEQSDRSYGAPEAPPAPLRYGRTDTTRDCRELA
jgi:putative transposase